MDHPTRQLVEILRKSCSKAVWGVGILFPSTTPLRAAVPLPTLRVGRRILAVSHSE